jgi:ABC-type transporter Mla subunit MlaD
VDTLSLVLLGVIALGSLLQGAFLIAVALTGRRVGRRLEQLRQRADLGLRPSIDNLTRVTRNLAEVSDLAARQGRRVDDTLAQAAAKLDRTGEELRQTAVDLMAPLQRASAVVKGLRRGFVVYQQLGGLEAQGRGAARQYRDDEHLFI